jgi:lipopolysaccharide/colanic/teichoic acid biosynthesis glycosyltransferase
MGTIVSILLGLLALLCAVSTKIIADEFKSWAPLLVRSLIAVAVRRLPAEERSRFSEEWQSHVNDVPGDLGKVIVATGYLLAAWKIAFEPFAFQKRLLDLCFSLCAIVGLFPLTLLIALAIKLDDGGPILDHETRVGQHGKKIRVYKFRTTALCAAWDVEPHPDEQYTRTGFILERSAIVQLPVYLSVLKGDMSVVGPRPRSDEDRRSADDSYLSCKPGITGLLHISGTAYSQSRSIMLDLKIIFLGSSEVIAYLVRRLLS